MLGIAGYKDQYPSQADLTLFMSEYRDDAIAATYTVERINGGGYEQNNPSAEPDVDMQLSQAIDYPIPHIFYSIGGKMRWTPDTRKPVPLGDAFQEWLKYLLTQKNIPRTISASYGFPEKNLPPEYTTALYDLFGQLGARGVSVLSSPLVITASAVGIAKNPGALSDSPPHSLQHMRVMFCHPLGVVHTHA
ncbi:hypothetical protein EI94DRAFT_498515 [Lactarius quietus]|nr:hypothetical protein EI94DRAFT_498515 [Lactarius quietus]